ncbi:type II-A CRISPR-associated protein Csn2 [Ligilactobacillus pabuli]|uniref:Type II-A CRISPR-associated protein Csn2 n=1 Tax=Ligilactobacillus pabuli TaxID=2886039 RepID=A0ABQ5JIM2_9LACO|nr:type II-A CRISPR-associated protein Csn2 [Ligilactobacillus pabuli]GKS81137.1 type II-A CRISPR-associated protein Csn2 [Ligilactobacillus pabuli]
MKLSYATHKPFNIEPGKITVIATDSSVVYSDLILSLKGQKDLLRFLNDEMELVEVNKSIDWLGDLMIQQDISKRYLPIVLKKLFAAMPDVQRNKIHEATVRLDNVIQESLYLTDLPMKITYDFDLKKVLKFTDTHLDSKTLTDAYDIIKTIIQIHEMCELKSCLAVNNVAHYLTAGQIEELAEFLQDVIQPIILIEFTDMSQANFYSNCNFYYIDKDFVDWY